MMGIYFLLDGKNVVYVGRSECCEKRILHHIGTDKIFDDYRIIECLDSTYLATCENRLIRFFKPKYNNQSNPIHNWGLQKRFKLNNDIVFVDNMAPLGHYFNSTKRLFRKLRTGYIAGYGQVVFYLRLMEIILIDEDTVKSEYVPFKK
jgi:hypothetical protein